MNKSFLLRTYIDAHLCKLSYHNYDFYNFRKISSKNVHCNLVSFKDNSKTIVIPGSKNFKDHRNNIKLYKYFDHNLNISFHSGFYFHSLEILDVLQNNIDKNTTYNLTGHSLGAASSVICALLLKHYGYNINLINTFGQPAFTDIDGASFIDDNLCNYNRFVINSDFVCNYHTLYPFNKLNYHHTNNKFLFSNFNNNLLDNHKIDAYLYKIFYLIKLNEKTMR